MIRLRPSGVDEILIKRVQDWYEPGPGVFIQSLTTALFSPEMLFTGSTTGAWYDPSDFTTLFQDAAGTTPVTAVEQPVGLMLDKSKGLVLGPELVTNGDFSNGLTGWTQTGGYTPTVSGGALVFNGGSSTGGVFQTLGSVGKVYQITYTITAYTAGAFKVSIGTTYGPLRTAAGTYTETRQAIGDNLLRIYGESTTFVGSVDNISVRELPGNHAFNSSGNSANFPVLQQDGTGRYYLAFNGTNQWLQTNSIDFTYGDKMFVCAGVRKLSLTTEVIVELSTASSNNGSFLAYCATNGYVFNSKGTAPAFGAIASAAGFTSPITNVFTGLGNISGDQSILRINGSQAAISTADQGTGNYGNYPIYIGARGGSSLWFNGRLYQMVVAGKQASDAEITSTETYLNNKTGAWS